jgi:hypothetical protein
LARFEFEFRIILFYFSFILVSFGKSRLLVLWCAGGRCGMTCNDEDCDRSRRPRVSQSGLNIGGCAMTDGACDTIAEVASEAS